VGNQQTIENKTTRGLKQEKKKEKKTKDTTTRGEPSSLFKFL
jgi:hypothetical protein